MSISSFVEYIFINHMNKLKTYLINLPRSKERRKAMEESLSNIPALDLTILNAIDGKSLNDHDLETHYSPKKAKEYLFREMTLTEIGCALSHIECYRQLLASSNPFALILEDDVIISATLFDNIPALAQLMECTQPVILLCTPDLIIKRYTKRQLNEKIMIGKYFSGVYAAGYLINRAAARYLLDHFYPVHCLADSWRLFNRDKKIALWSLIPPAALFHTLSTISTIEKRVLKPLKTKRRKTLKESLKGSFYRLCKKTGLALCLLEHIK